MNPSYAYDTNSELRNRIYHFAVKPSSGIPKPGNGPAIGLTQVCCQIRSEFRDTYLRDTIIGVTWNRIPKYIDVFYPAANGQHLQNIQNCPSHLYILMNTHEDLVPNLLPLVKMKVAHPQLQFTVIFELDVSYYHDGYFKVTRATIKALLNELPPGIVHDIKAMKISKIYYSIDHCIFHPYNPNAAPYAVRLDREDGEAVEKLKISNSILWWV